MEPVSGNIADFSEDLFSGTRARARAVNTAGYSAKKDDPLWFNGAVTQSSAEERRKTLKVKLDYLYYQRNWQAAVELSSEMLAAESKKDNSLRKELIETKARALMNLQKYADTARLLDAHREEFGTIDLELVWCMLRATCAVELGLDEQATSFMWRVVCITPEHVPCWMKLTEVLMRRKTPDILVPQLALLCALRLKAILARVTAFPGRKSAGKLAWPTSYSISASALVDSSIAELARRGVTERDGFVQGWCETAKQACWNPEELQLISKCLLTTESASTPAEDINPAGL